MSYHGDACKTKSCPDHPDAICRYITYPCTSRYYYQVIEVTNNDCGMYNNNIYIYIYIYMTSPFYYI